MSGAKRDRPVLAEALVTLRPGDVFVAWKLDRLARSLSHLKEVVDDLNTRGIHLRSLTEGFDTTTAAGKMIFHVIGAMAEFERSLIEERCEAGLARVRAAGKKFGRRSAADPAAKEDKSGRSGKGAPGRSAWREPRLSSEGALHRPGDDPETYGR